MRFCHVTLYVKDLDASLAFYSGVLGLPIARRSEGKGFSLAMLGEEGNAKIELIEGLDGEPAGSSIGFAVPSLEDVMKLLDEKNIPILRGPISPMEGVTFIFIKDPDGHIVQFMESDKE